MEKSTTLLIRRSIYTFLQFYHYFTATAAILCKFNVCNFLSTFICNFFVLLSANSTAFCLLFFGFHLFNGFGFSSSPNWLIFMSAASAVLYSVILANALIICNLALVSSGMEKSASPQKPNQAKVVQWPRCEEVVSIPLGRCADTTPIACSFQLFGSIVPKQLSQFLVECFLLLPSRWEAVLPGLKNPKTTTQNNYPTLPQPPKSPPPLLPPTTPFLPTYNPSPAHPTKPKTPSTPLRFLKKSFPSPPAKHIRAVLRRWERNKKAAGIAETKEDEDGVEPDKRLGVLKELRSKLEIGEEVGYICSAKLKKGS
ncbi:hypothetical protein Gotur_013577 [Gossypium turneri]